MEKGQKGEEAQKKVRRAVQKSQRGSKAGDLQTSYYSLGRRLCLGSWKRKYDQDAVK